jgi:hypothetical protein
LQYGGVLYVDSADKTTRFIMDCNQARLPLVFLQDVNGFMVGRDSEQKGMSSGFFPATPPPGPYTRACAGPRTWSPDDERFFSFGV